MTHFGPTIRTIREDLREDDRRYSVRQVAGRVGIEPAYLSKIERGEVAPPSEATTVKLAKELGEDPDVMLALAGKVSADLQAHHSQTAAPVRGPDPSVEKSPRRGGFAGGARSARGQLVRRNVNDRA